MNKLSGPITVAASNTVPTASPASISAIVTKALLKQEFSLPRKHGQHLDRRWQQIAPKTIRID